MQEDLGYGVVDRQPQPQNTTVYVVDQALMRIPTGMPKLRLRHAAIAFWVAAAIIVVFSIFSSPQKMTSNQMKHSLPAQPKI